MVSCFQVYTTGLWHVTARPQQIPRIKLGLYVSWAVFDDNFLEPLLCYIYIKYKWRFMDIWFCCYWWPVIAKGRIDADNCRLNTFSCDIHHVKCVVHALMSHFHWHFGCTCTHRLVIGSLRCNSYYILCGGMMPVSGAHMLRSIRWVMHNDAQAAHVYCCKRNATGLVRA